MLGIDTKVHDIRFVEDNWESPTLGAWGLGWEVWLNGMEVTQFTYFQQVGGLECRPVTGEITYGLERLAMYLQDVESIFDIVWTDGPLGRITYGDVYHQNEVEQSKYNFEFADIDELFHQFDHAEHESVRLIEAGLALPAYEQMLHASHVFNLLDARQAISVSERQRFILRVRTMARAVAEAYYASREALGFPMELVGPKRIRELHPFYNLDGVRAALHTPKDGHVDPAGAHGDDLVVRGDPAVGHHRGHQRRGGTVEALQDVAVARHQPHEGGQVGALPPAVHVAFPQSQ